MDLVHQTHEMAKRRPKLGHIFPEERKQFLTLETTIPLEGWGAFLRLLSRRWFTRYWVIQEVAMGTSPVVVCGLHAVKWDAVHGVCKWIWKSIAMFKHMWSRDLAIRSVDPRWEGPVQIDRARRAAHMAEFQRRLILFKKSQATDPRDRIFALLGLAPESSPPGIRPDYKTSVEDLYLQVSRFFFERGGDVMILELTGVGSERSLDLPSWVVDWTSPSSGSTSLSKWTAAAGRNAAEGTEMQTKIDDAHRDTMWLHGCAVDSIKQLSSTRESGSAKPWMDEVTILARRQRMACGRHACGGPW